MWKGNGNALLFFLKGLEILHRDRRGQVNSIVMEHEPPLTSPDLLTSSISINQLGYTNKIRLLFPKCQRYVFCHIFHVFPSHLGDIHR